MVSCTSETAILFCADVAMYHSNTIKTEKSEPVKRKLDCISCNFVDKLQKNDESFPAYTVCLPDQLNQLGCQTDGMLFNLYGYGSQHCLGVTTSL